MGYPGGVAWAIMVARICQLYPLASTVTLVEMFFKRFSSWNWPTPVILTNLSEGDPYKLSPWNPKVSNCKYLLLRYT